MDKQSEKKITWTIKNFSSFLRSKKIYSDNFVVGGCKWRLCACSKGNDADYIFLFLEVADFETLPFGWRRHVRYLLSLVNYNSVKRSKQNEAQKWFDDKSPRWGHLSMFPINEIQAKGSGFLLNEEPKIVAEVEVLEVIGDVSEVPSTIMETMDVNGFHLLSSQVDFVSHMFERQPEIASNFSAKNPHLRTGYMSLLLSLIETLRQSPNELHMADLAQADLALRYLTLAGFKLDWLEKKFDEMIEKRRKEKAGETQMQETEEKLEDLKHKCSVLEAQLAKEKAEVSAAKSPISFEDVI